MPSIIMNVEEGCNPDPSTSSSNDQIKHHDVLEIDKNGIRKQIIIVTLMSIGDLLIGAMTTYPSIFYSSVQRDNTTIFGSTLAFTETEYDSVGSLYGFGGFIGSIPAGLTMAYLGRKVTTYIGNIMTLISCCGVALSPNVYGILGMRFVGGIGSSFLSFATNTYVAEIGDNNFRGMLFTILITMMLVGEVLPLIIGYWCKYYITSLILTVLSILYFAAIYYIPESPAYLVTIGQKEKAREYLNRIRGSKIDIDNEIEVIHALNNAHKDKLSALKKLIQPEILRPLVVVCCLMMFSIFTGYMTVTTQTSRIFQSVSPSFDKDLAAIIVNTVQCAPMILSGYLLDKYGRKIMLLLSEVIIFCCMFLFALYSQFLTQDFVEVEGNSFIYNSTDIKNMTVTWDDNIMNETQTFYWVPILLLTLDFCGIAIGLRHVPFLLGNEYFPAALRPQVNVTITIAFFVFGFISVQLYTPVTTILGEHGLFYIFAAFGMVSIPFSVFFVEETKGVAVG